MVAGFCWRDDKIGEFKDSAFDNELGEALVAKRMIPTTARPRKPLVMRTHRKHRGVAAPAQSLDAAEGALRSLFALHP